MSTIDFHSLLRCCCRFVVRCCSARLLLRRLLRFTLHDRYVTICDYRCSVRFYTVVHTTFTLRVLRFTTLHTTLPPLRYVTFGVVGVVAFLPSLRFRYSDSRYIVYVTIHCSVRSGRCSVTLNTLTFVGDGRFAFTLLLQFYVVVHCYDCWYSYVERCYVFYVDLIVTLRTVNFPSPLPSYGPHVYRFLHIAPDFVLDYVHVRYVTVVPAITLR